MNGTRFRGSALYTMTWPIAERRGKTAPNTSGSSNNSRSQMTTRSNKAPQLASSFFVIKGASILRRPAVGHCAAVSDFRRLLLMRNPRQEGPARGLAAIGTGPNEAGGCGEAMTCPEIHCAGRGRKPPAVSGIRVTGVVHTPI